MGEILEMLMVIAFGISWPLNIIKSYKARTAKGKSLLFLLFIFFGYVCGILSKVITDNITYVFIFYCINIVMVLIDIVLYYRNVWLDRNNEKNIK